MRGCVLSDVLRYIRGALVNSGFIVLADSTENVRNAAIYSDLTCVYAGGEKVDPGSGYRK